MESDQTFLKQKVGVVKCIVTFGEIMARMAPPGVLRLSQSLPGSLDITFAGAEANVAASLAMLGARTRFATALPAESPLTQACLTNLRGLGIDLNGVKLHSEGRFGIYFVETGANQRPSRVTYDRSFSSISMAGPQDFNWDEILMEAGWLHLTGITPALSEAAAETTLEAARQATARGIQISLDVNFRSKLWRWNPGQAPEVLARHVLRQLLPLVDLLLANADDARLLGIAVDDLPPVDQNPQKHHALLAQRMIQEFPRISLLATTFRESLSASHNNWGALLFDAASHGVFCAPRRDGEFRPYEIRNIVDRVGGGDAFVAGLLFALHQSKDLSLQKALEFATAASCLAHSVVGDFNFATESEIRELMQGSESGRVVR